MVYIQTKANPNAPGLATDETSPMQEEAINIVGGAWTASPAEEGNYMIRARVDYAIDKPTITTPDADLLQMKKVLQLKELHRQQRQFS